MALHHKQPESAAPRPVLAHERAWTRRFPRWRRQSILARLQVSHLLAALLPLLALGFVLLYNSAESERRIVEQTQLSVATAVARDIASMLGQTDSDLLSFGRQLRLSEADERLIQEDIEQFFEQQFPDIIELSFVNEQGQEITRVTQDEVFSSSAQRNRVDEPFFATTQQGLLYHSISHAPDGSQALQVAVPARNGVGQVKGAVVALLTTQYIELRLATVPQAMIASTFIIDDQGKVLLGQPTETLVGVRDLREWAAQETPLASLRDSAGQSVSAARALVERNPDTWWLVVEQQSAVAFAGSQRNTTLLLLVLAGTCVVVVLWGLVVARQMTRPILQLRDGVQEVASGQLGGTIEVRREDELGQLAREFNRMSERLATTQQAVEQRNARLSEGLNLARVIQRDLLPPTPPDAGITAHAVCEPATEIGGDFYTYVPLPDGRIRLVIGDASGKGVAAALVMALTSSLVEIHARQTEGPADLLQRLNVELYQRLHSSHTSVSLLVAEFDPQRRQLCAANAGMIAPLIAAPDGYFYVSCFGPPLGVIDNVAYVEATVELEPDQVAVFVSDGIVEARNAANEMWGFHQLEVAVCRAAHRQVYGLVSHVMAEIKAHVRHTPPADDMTIIATSFTPSPESNHAYARHPEPAALVPADHFAADRM